MVYREVEPKKSSPIQRSRSLTGICVEMCTIFAKSRHLGFHRASGGSGRLSADQWLFTLSDLMVLVTLFPKCTH